MQKYTKGGGSPVPLHVSMMANYDKRSKVQTPRVAQLQLSLHDNYLKPSIMIFNPSSILIRYLRSRTILTFCLMLLRYSCTTQKQNIHCIIIYHQGF